MNTDTQYLHLSTRCPHPNRTSKGWIAKALGTIVCARCRRVLDRSQGIDVVLDEPPVNTSLNCIGFIEPYTVTVKLKRHLDQYGFSEQFRFGKVFDESGNEYPEFCTFYSPHVVRMRGTNKSTLRRCEVCRSILHSPIYPYYLLRRDYEALNGAPLAMSQISLIIRSDLWKDGLKDSREWKYLSFEKLPVKDAPIDGFPENLEDFDKEEQTP